MSDKVSTDALDLIKREKLFFGPTEDTGFAGGVYDSDGSTMGLIERRPHNDVHVAIGGIVGNDKLGLMTEVQRAAFDPIFWVHHANIDRLFEMWVRLPNREWGYFPEASWFVEKPWFFYDAEGAIHNEPRHYYLYGRNIRASYDDIDSSFPALTDKLPYDFRGTASFLATLPENFSIDSETGLSTNRVIPSCECCRRKASRTVLSTETETTIELNTIGSSVTSMKLMSLKPLVARPERSPQTMLEISFSLPRKPLVLGYEVLLSSQGPAGKPIRKTVGNLSLFGTRHHSLHRTQPAGIVTQSFNITPFVSEMLHREAQLVVTLRPYSLYSQTAPKMSRGAGKIIVTNIDIKVN
ncbi:MAG: tyrosinase family protein [Lacipirellulaceae bacterium]